MDLSLENRHAQLIHNKETQQFVLKYNKLKINLSLIELSSLHKNLSSLYKDSLVINNSWYRAFLIRLCKTSRTLRLSRQEIIDLWDLLSALRSLIELEYIIKDFKRN